MGPVWALLLLLPIAQGAEPVCNARENHTQCYGALGGIIQIQLIDSGSMTERYRWNKNKSKIFEWKDNNVSINNVKDRSEFIFNSGIFQLRNLSKSDTDSYTLEYISRETGLVDKTFHHKITIEAPVSSLDLQSQCLSNGEVQVTWTSEGGDNPEFSCTLNRHNLTDPQLLSRNEENKTIILKQNTEGPLNCSVKNHVSEVKRDLQISSCGHQYIIYGALAGVLVIGIAVIVLICVLKKKKNNKDDKDEEPDLTYADVTILQKPGRRQQQQRPLEMEVEYGQVKFSNQNQNVSEAPDDACIYAKVRR